jgi:YVTN family beta-propeller protein
MDSAKYVSRVGGLAVAVGLGVAVATNTGVAQAEPTDSSGASAGSSPGSAADSTSGASKKTGHSASGPSKAPGTASKVHSAKSTGAIGSLGVRTSKLSSKDVAPTELPAVTSAPAILRAAARPAATPTVPAAGRASSGAPAAPAPAGVFDIGGILALVRRDLFNETPRGTSGPTTQLPNGTITGEVGATDGDGDPVTYKVTRRPGDGSVVVNDDGSYAYTPNADLLTSGGTDKFVVTVSDANAEPHIHGPLGLFNSLVALFSPALADSIFPGGAHDTKVAVVVAVTGTAPANHAPVAGSPGTPAVNSQTGVVTAGSGFSDPDGDALTYSVVTGPTKGTVVANANGTYTYTPNAAARPPAGSAAGSDVFTLSASDGHLSTPTTITVPVAALPPVQPPNTFTVTDTITIDGYPDNVTVGSNGKLYVVSGTTIGNNTVYVVNRATDKVVGSILVGSNPVALAFNPTKPAIAYVVNAGDGTISVIDTTSNTVSPLTGIGINPRSVAFAPDGLHAYLPDQVVGNSSVLIVSTKTGKVVDKIPVTYGPSGIVLSPDGGTAYVSGSTSGTPPIVSVVNIATKSVKTINVGTANSAVGDLALSKDGKVLYVASSGDNSVSVIDTTSNTVVKTITIAAINGTPAGPTDVALSPDGSVLYVTDTNASSVTVINTATRSVIATVPVGFAPGSVTVAPDGTAYVTNLFGKSVSVITPSRV